MPCYGMCTQVHSSSNAVPVRQVCHSVFCGMLWSSVVLHCEWLNDCSVLGAGKKIHWNRSRFFRDSLCIARHNRQTHHRMGESKRFSCLFGFYATITYFFFVCTQHMGLSSQRFSQQRYYKCPVAISINHPPISHLSISPNAQDCVSQPDMPARFLYAVWTPLKLKPASGPLMGIFIAQLIKYLLKHENLPLF